jgi:hypothetical protein
LENFAEQNKIKVGDHPIAGIPNIIEKDFEVYKKQKHSKKLNS